MQIIGIYFIFKVKVKIHINEKNNNLNVLEKLISVTFANDFGVICP